MAQKRMFSKDVVDSEQFYSLPFNSQLLYFHLGINADVKGFVQPQKIVRLTGLKLVDLKPLIEKNFVIAFKSGVVVITHWNINNIIREERETRTIFSQEFESLLLDKGLYQLQENSGSTPAQIRLDKIRLDKIRLGEENNFFKNKENTNKDFIRFKTWYLSKGKLLPKDFKNFRKSFNEFLDNPSEALLDNLYKMYLKGNFSLDKYTT